VAEYQDPPNVRRAPEGKQLVAMLLDGEIDAAIVGDKFPDARLKPLIRIRRPPTAGGRRTMAACPINHMLVIRRAPAQTRPDVVRGSLSPGFGRPKRPHLPKPAYPSSIRFASASRPIAVPLETVIDFSVKQGLLPRRFGVDELFSDIMRGA